MIRTGEILQAFLWLLSPLCRHFREHIEDDRFLKPGRTNYQGLA